MVVERRIKRGHDTKISRSALLYLFADRCVERSRLTNRLSGNAAAPLPCSRRLVRLGPLEQWLMTWAVWELAEGPVTLDLVRVPEGSLQDAARKVFLTNTGETTETRSLASSLLTAVPTQPTSVEDVIESWATDQAPLPLFGVVREIRLELVAANLISTEIVKPPLRRRWFSNLVLSGMTADCAKISTLLERFESASETWSTLEADDPEMANALFRSSRLGLAKSRLSAIGAGAPGPG